MRADRLLSILLLLQGRRRLTARDLARRLEVSERTILRDMDALSGSNVPVVAERGRGGGWSLLAEYETKLTGMTPAEIHSLFLARPSRLMSDLGMKRESEAALIKLQASLPAAVRKEADLVRSRILIDPRGWRDPAESIPCLPVLLAAIWRGKQVRFLYARDGCETTERIAHPLGLVAKGSTWYLVARVASAKGADNRRQAFKELAKPLGGAPDTATVLRAFPQTEVRTYRVSRMREAAVLDAPAEYPQDFDLSAHWDGAAAQFREKLPRYYATFLVQPSVMRWARYRGWRVEEERPEGERIRLKLRFDIEEEAVQFALSFGADLQVVEPAELREKVLAGARAILQENAR